MNPAAQAAAEHLARRYDEIIERALNDALGCADWDPDAVKARVLMQAAPDGDTFYLDGEPLLWIGPLKMTEGPGGAITCDREWRMLR